MKRLLYLLASAVTAVVLAVGLNPGAANAATYHGCADGYLCFWDWQSYNDAGGRMNIHAQDIYTRPGQCLNLGDLHFTVSGLSGYHRATAMVFNRLGVAGQGDTVIFYGWVNCNAAGGGSEFAIQADQLQQVYNLDYSPWGQWNNAIASVRYVG